MNISNDDERLDLTSLRTAVKKASGRNISSFQNQVLRDAVDNDILLIGTRREELRSLAVGILAGLGIQESSVIPKPMREAAELSVQKGKDYNAAVGRRAYFPFGLKSYSQMIHVKCLRLCNLAETGSSANFESVRDTCLDLINYASFLAEALDNQELK